MGNLTRIITAAGVTTEFRRDALGRVVEMTRPRRGTYQIAYGAGGTIEKLTLPSGQEVFLHWSPDRRVLTESDAQGLLTEQHFDLLGRLILLRDAVGATTEYGYGKDGYLAEIIHPDTSRQRFVSDAEGRLSEMQDEAGGITTWTYDEAGRCLSVTLPNGDSIRSEYDSEKRLTAIQGPDGLWHRYEYDPRGLVTRQEFSDGRVAQYEYDARGLLVTMGDPSGAVIQVERDAVGRITRILYPDHTEKTVQYNPDGQWLRVEWNGHILERDVNEEGHPIVERQDNFVLHQEFGKAGEPLAIVDSLGRKIIYSYDKNGRVIAAQTLTGIWSDGQWEPVSEHAGTGLSMTEWEISYPGKCPQARSNGERMI